jgi:membrane fusion protein (multidrug efflux system)
MRSRIRIIAAVLVVAAIGVGAWFWLTAGRESTDDAQVDAPVTQVAARVGGTITKVAVNDNQRVEVTPCSWSSIAVTTKSPWTKRAPSSLTPRRPPSRHAASVPITSTTAASNVTTARGGIAQAQGGIAGAERELDAARARLVTAQARVREAEATAAKAARDVERLRGLLAKDEVSQQQFDSLVAAADAQKAGLDSARSQVAEAEAGIRVAESKVIQARAGAEQAHAELRTAETAPQQVSMTKARAAAA